MKILLPPISINKVYRGRRFATKEYKKWVNDGLLLLPAQETILGPVEVHFIFSLKYPKRSDLDNYLKTAIDLLVKRKYIGDDRQIQRIRAEKEQSEEENIVFSIMPIKISKLK